MRHSAFSAFRLMLLSSFTLGALSPLVASAPQTAAPAAPASSLVPLKVEILAPAGTPIPQFAVDAAWPTMPKDLMLGQVSGVAVDAQDNVWLTHRPHSLTDTDKGLAQTPPTAVCCRPAPPIVQFSNDGRYLQGWGGAETAPTMDGVNQWPASTHGLYVDAKGTVWFGGNGKDDHAVLNYTNDGKFIRAFGKRGVTAGNLDKSALGNPADVYHEDGEVLIADGYINKRVIGFDGKTNGFAKYWGAFASSPDAPVRQGDFDQSQATSNTDGGANPESRMFGDIVHCVVPTSDGHIYVCDRRNNRAQLFRKDKKGVVSFVRNLPIAPQTGGTRTVTDIALSPDEKYLYVADMMNGRIWILLRETHQVLAAIGRNGRQPGQFIWLHSIDTDSKGNIYTTEVATGRRIQKLVFTGMK